MFWLLPGSHGTSKQEVTLREQGALAWCMPQRLGFAKAWTPFWRSASSSPASL